MPKLSCVVLACGCASRFGSNKLLVDLDGKPLILYTLEAIPQSYFDEILVITHYSEIESILKTHFSSKFRVIFPPETNLEMGYTIRFATSLISPKSIGCMYCVGDQPLKKQSSLEKQINLFLKNQDFIVALSFEDKRGNPVIFPKNYFTELSLLKDNESGKTVIKNHIDKLILSPAKYVFELQDIDYVDDFKNIKSIIYNRKLD